MGPMLRTFLQGLSEAQRHELLAHADSSADVSGSIGSSRAGHGGRPEYAERTKQQISKERERRHLLEVQVSSLQAALKDKTSQLNETRVERDALRQQLLRHDDRGSRLAAQLASLEQENASLSAKLMAAVNERKQSESKIESMQVRILQLQQKYVSIAGACDDGTDGVDFARRSKLGGLLKDVTASGLLDGNLQLAAGLAERSANHKTVGSALAALSRERDALQQRVQDLSARLADAVSREGAARGAQAMRSASWKRAAVQAEARLTTALKRVKELGEELRRRDGEAKQRDRYVAQLERTLLAQHKSLQQQRRLLQGAAAAQMVPSPGHGDERSDLPTPNRAASPGRSRGGLRGVRGAEAAPYDALPLRGFAWAENRTAVHVAGCAQCPPQAPPRDGGASGGSRPGASPERLPRRAMPCDGGADGVVRSGWSAGSGRGPGQESSVRAGEVGPMGRGPLGQSRGASEAGCAETAMGSPYQYVVQSPRARSPSPPAILHQQLSSMEKSLAQLYRELEEFKDYRAPGLRDEQEADRWREHEELSEELSEEADEGGLEDEQEQGQERMRRLGRCQLGPFGPPDRSAHRHAVSPSSLTRGQTWPLSPVHSRHNGNGDSGSDSDSDEHYTTSDSSCEQLEAGGIAPTGSFAFPHDPTGPSGSLDTLRPGASCTSPSKSYAQLYTADARQHQVAASAATAAGMGASGTGWVPASPRRGQGQGTDSANSARTGPPVPCPPPDAGGRQVSSGLSRPVSGGSAQSGAAGPASSSNLLPEGTIAIVKIVKTSGGPSPCLGSPTGGSPRGSPCGSPGSMRGREPAAAPSSATCGELLSAAAAAAASMYDSGGSGTAHSFSGERSREVAAVPQSYSSPGVGAWGSSSTAGPQRPPYDMAAPPALPSQRHQESRPAADVPGEELPRRPWPTHMLRHVLHCSHSTHTSRPTSRSTSPLGGAVAGPAGGGRVGPGAPGGRGYVGGRPVAASRSGAAMTATAATTTTGGGAGGPGSSVASCSHPQPSPGGKGRGDARPAGVLVGSTGVREGSYSARLLAQRAASRCCTSAREESSGLRSRSPVGRVAAAPASARSPVSGRDTPVRSAVGGAAQRPASASRVPRCSGADPGTPSAAQRPLQSQPTRPGAAGGRGDPFGPNAVPASPEALSPIITLLANLNAGSPNGKSHSTVTQLQRPQQAPPAESGDARSCSNERRQLLHNQPAERSRVGHMSMSATSGVREPPESGPTTSTGSGSTGRTSAKRRPNDDIADGSEDRRKSRGQSGSRVSSSSGGCGHGASAPGPVLAQSCTARCTSSSGGVTRTSSFSGDTGTRVPFHNVEDSATPLALSLSARPSSPRDTAVTSSALAGAAALQTSISTVLPQRPQHPVVLQSQPTAPSSNRCSSTASQSSHGRPSLAGWLDSSSASGAAAGGLLTQRSNQHQHQHGNDGTPARMSSSNAALQRLREKRLSRGSMSNQSTGPGILSALTIAEEGSNPSGLVDPSGGGGAAEEEVAAARSVCSDGSTAPVVVVTTVIKHRPRPGEVVVSPQRWSSGGSGSLGAVKGGAVGGLLDDAARVDGEAVRAQLELSCGSSSFSRQSDGGCSSRVGRVAPEVGLSAVCREERPTSVSTSLRSLRDAMKGSDGSSREGVATARSSEGEGSGRRGWARGDAALGSAQGLGGAMEEVNGVGRGFETGVGRGKGGGLGDGLGVSTDSGGTALHPLMQLLGQASQDLQLLNARLKPLVGEGV